VSLEGWIFVLGFRLLDVGLLIDVWRSQGIGCMAQVDLEVRQNRHQPLCDLVPMAEAVLGTVLNRLARDGRLALAEQAAFATAPFGARATTPPVRERPPQADVARAA